MNWSSQNDSLCVLLSFSGGCTAAWVTEWKQLSGLVGTVCVCGGGGADLFLEYQNPLLTLSFPHPCIFIHILYVSLFHFILSYRFLNPKTNAQNALRKSRQHHGAFVRLRWEHKRTVHAPLPLPVLSVPPSPPPSVKQNWRILFRRKFCF